MASASRQCNSLWIGERFGPLERACARSVLRQGHPLRLYCYDRPKDVPEGVDLADAAEIVPRDRIIRHRRGSVALFSNLFRYELLRRGAGTWLDLDLYLLKPLPEGDHLFGFEDETNINTAVLRLPPDCEFLDILIALFEEKATPPWLPLRERLASDLRLWRTGKTDLTKMPWGVAGPRALTALAKGTSLTSLAQPQTVFYPAPHAAAYWITDPDIRLEHWTSPDTVAVHLWNEAIKSVKDAPAAPGSFLARLQAEGAA